MLSTREKIIFGLLLIIYCSAIFAQPVNIITRIDPARVARKPIPEPGISPVVPKVTLPVTKKPVTPVGVKEVTLKLSNIIVKGTTVYSQAELKPLYAPFLGKTITLTDLQNIANAITVKYRSDGYFLSRAIIPVQKVKHGVIRILVIEGFVDKINIKGKVSPGTKQLLMQYAEKIQQSKPLRSQDMERYVLLVNDLPGISVRTVFSPSDDMSGATDLTFVVQQKRIDGYADFNNYGTRYLGPNQIDAGVSANSIFGTADRLSAYLLSTTNNDVRSAQLYYQRPVDSNGTNINLIGDFTQTRPGFLLDPFDLKGQSKRIVARVTHPFIRSRKQNLFVDVNVDFLDSETNSYMTDDPALLYKDKIGSVRLRGIYNYLDSYSGINTLTLVVAQGIPGVGNNTDDPNSSRIGGHSDYTKFNFYASRLQALPKSFSALLAVTGQYAFDPLLSVEEFGFGGRGFGRGYDPSELTGDSGLAGKLEFRWTKYPNHKVLQQIQLFTFCDTGIVWNYDAKESGQFARQDATSMGVGMSIDFLRYIKAELEVDKPLTYAVQADKFAGHSGYGWREFFNLSAVF